MKVSTKFNSFVIFLTLSSNLSLFIGPIYLRKRKIYYLPKGIETGVGETGARFKAEMLALPELKIGNHIKFYTF